jgi:NAD(P)H dehydrogenase (quinone)
MRVHLIHAHPEGDSFVCAMRDVLIDEFAKAGAQVSVADLYKMKFNPLLSSDDFLQRKDPDHLVFALEQRHAYETGTLAPDIAAEIDNLRAADLLVFTFPVYWFSVPAILKGWIDRVFISGLCYGGRRIYSSGGLQGKRAFAAFSIGSREPMFGDNSLHGNLQTGMLRHFLQGTLGYVGLAVHEPFVAWHVPYITAEARTSMLDDLRATVRSLDSRSVMPMPDLSRFDRTFAPLQQ